jgi:hypothetical protein
MKREERFFPVFKKGSNGQSKGLAKVPTFKHQSNINIKTKRKKQ